MATVSETARVAVADVLEIFETTLTETQVAAFINTSTLLVDEELVGVGLSADRLVQIELYLAAHFCSLNDPRAESEKIGDYSTKVQGKTAMALDATFYGQQAKLLDSTGTLDALGANKELVQFGVLEPNTKVTENLTVSEEG